MTYSRLSAALIAFALLFAGSASSAAVVTYTDHDTFVTALPGPASTLTFDSLVAGTTIVDGGTVGGITFNYDFGGVQMQVRDFQPNSPPNSLGTDVGIFQEGDDFNLSFGPVNAIGMFFITQTSAFPPDSVMLAAGGGSVGLSPFAPGITPSGDWVYFLGIIDDVSPFTAASITTPVSGLFFSYTMDDITTAAVPLPAAAWLFGSGIVFIFGLLARQRSKLPAQKDASCKA
jgi:hypothetical protein